MTRRTRKAFKLVELIVVLALIAVLICLLLPARRRVQGAADRVICMNNLKQLLLAMHNYASAHTYPDVEPTLPTGCFGPGATPEERLSWMVKLLPYLEHDKLYEQFDTQSGYAGNLLTAQLALKSYQCPEANEGARRFANTNYVALAGIGLDAASRPAGAPGNGFMGFDRITSFSMIKDGTSNTLAVAETRFDVGPWARGGTSTLRGFDPVDLPVFGADRPFGGHTNGFNVGRCDGSIYFLTSSIDPAMLAAMITIDGGETVQFDY